MRPLEMSRPSSNYSPGTEQTSMHETKGGKRRCTSLSIKDTWALSRCYSTSTSGLVCRYKVLSFFLFLKTWMKRGWEGAHHHYSPGISILVLPGAPIRLEKYYSRSTLYNVEKGKLLPDTFFIVLPRTFWHTLFYCRRLPRVLSKIFITIVGLWRRYPTSRCHLQETRWYAFPTARSSCWYDDYQQQRFQCYPPCCITRQPKVMWNYFSADDDVATHFFSIAYFSLLGTSQF